MVTGIRKVVVPVDDQLRALEFWTKSMGFAVALDQPFGTGERWIEVSPADGSISLVLSRRRPDEPRREVPVQLPHSPIFFCCQDIQETHRQLSARGVTFAAAPVEMPFGWWSMFEDQEGTRYALGQW